jgi:hypothetical protein
MPQDFRQSLVADVILAKLFRRHFYDTISALRKFEKLLSGVDLSFGLKTQLRELKYPPQPEVPYPPNHVYYFVPDSQKGLDKVIDPIEFPDPLHPIHLHKADGIGINMGCPVRLYHALDALDKLPKADQKSPRDCLKNPQQHLNTVEELLWLFGWKSMTGQKRGGQIQGASGDVDWTFEAAGLPVYLEAKFRESDWMRLTDKNSYMMVGEGFLSKAAHKFPKGSSNTGLHVVGITFYDTMTHDILNHIGDELRAAPQIDVVIARSFLQMTHVISIKQDVRDAIFGALEVPTNKDFPMIHGVMCDRAEQDERMKHRPKLQSTINNSGVMCWPITPRVVIPLPPMIDGLYRMDIPWRRPDGEPIYKVIPPSELFFPI